MNVIRYKTVSPYEKAMLNQNANRENANESTLAARPGANVWKNRDGYVIELAVPGFEKKDVNLKIDDDQLHIEAKKEAENKEDFMMHEFNTEFLQRTFILPDDVDSEAIKAHYKNGVLRIELPLQEDKKPVSKTIDVV